MKHKPQYGKDFFTVCLAIVLIALTVFVLAPFLIFILKLSLFLALPIVILILIILCTIFFGHIINAFIQKGGDGPGPSSGEGE